MAKIKKTIVAGPLVIETVYPMPNPRDSEGVRAGKKALSSEAQQRMNLKYAWQKLELELAANYTARDLWVTLTYDDDHLPQSREDALKQIKAFVKRLRKARAARGENVAVDFRYHYNIEHKHGEGRWHHHFFATATGDDYDMIRECWGKGNVEFRKIRVDAEKNFETLARYMCKEARDKIGQRLWSCSRNVKKVEYDRQWVPEDENVTPPSTATVLFDTGDVRTAYGHYRYVKYMAYGWQQSLSARAKARRKRPRR